MIARTFAIFKRELWNYFTSPIAYCFATVFLAVSNGMFMLDYFASGVNEMRSFFGLMPFILCVLVPSLTMRSWSEERKNGSIEFLLTLPLPPFLIIVAKFLATTVFYIFVLLLTGIIPIMLSSFGTPDWGPVITGYAGAFSLGVMFISLGMFISVLTREQIVAFIISMVICLAVFLLGHNWVAMNLDSLTPADSSFKLGSWLADNIGAASHLESFSRGVIDGKEVVYFLTYSLGFLMLNAMFLDAIPRIQRKLMYVVGAIITVLIVFFLNGFVSEVSMPVFDATEGRLYTLSQDMKTILSKLRVPIKVTYYISPSDRLPTPMRNLQRDLSDKIGEMKKVTDKLEFKVVIVDPSVDSKIEDEVKKKGVKRLQVPSFEDKAIKEFFSQMTIEYLDKQAETFYVFLDTLQTLDYEIATRIDRLTREHPPRVALIETEPDRNTNPFMQKPDIVGSIEKALRINKYATVRVKISKDKPIPNDADAIFLTTGDDLKPRQIYELSRAISAGKSVVIAIQSRDLDLMPYENDIGMRAEQCNRNLCEWLGKYGIAIDKDIVCDPDSEQLSTPSQWRLTQEGIEQVPGIPIKQKIFLNISNLNTELSITNGVAKLFLPYSCRILLDNSKLGGITAKTIASTGSGGWTVPFRESVYGPNETAQGSRECGAYPIAVFLSGQFPNVYEGQPPPKWNEESKDEPQEPTPPPVVQKPARVIIVGCHSLFKSELLDFANRSDNFTLLVNSIDAIALEETLIGIRSKKPVERTIKFEKKKDGKTVGMTPEERAGSKTFWRVMSIGGPSIAVILLGFLRLAFRRMSRNSYVRSAK